MIESVGPCWRFLSTEGRYQLAEGIQGRSYAGVVDWLVTWLEECGGWLRGDVADAEVQPSASALDREAAVSGQTPEVLWGVARTQGGLLKRQRLVPGRPGQLHQVAEQVTEQASPIDSSVEPLEIVLQAGVLLEKLCDRHHWSRGRCRLTGDFDGPRSSADPWAPTDVSGPQARVYPCTGLL